MKKIALVTDSTADIPQEIKDLGNVHVIPLRVRFGNSEYKDDEISSDDFYSKLRTAPELPKTSQPSPEEFVHLYRNLLEQYSEVISLHISSGLSGTVNAAFLAKEKLVGKIHIIDTKTISLGAGLMVLEAANLIKEGLETSHIVDKLTKARTNIETLFTLNTLEYLQKGGRIGRVQGLVGSLLNVKPIIRVGDDGIYQSYGKARSQENALNTIVRAFQSMAKGRKQVRIAVAHGAASQAGLYLKEALENTFELPTSIFTQVGPVIGVHTGPGTVGAAIQFD